MRKQLLLISALSLSFFVSKAQLTYTQVTTGLGSYMFEGGESEIELGDIDGDGDLDIVSIGDHGSPQGGSEAGIMIWKNNGTGTTWSASKSGNFGYGGVALGDVNGDGKMDIGFGQHHNYPTSGLGSKYMNIGLGNGTGSVWTPYDTGLADTAVTGMSWGMFGTDFGDINNDGKLDIASVSFGCCDGLWLFKNMGNGSWTSTAGKPTGNVLNSAYCEFGDFNNDGNTDIAVSTQAGTVYKNNGQGVLTAMATGLPSDWTMKLGVNAMDVNGDGGKDICIVTPGSGPGGQIFVYTYDKSSNSWKSISAGLPPASKAVFGAALDDMDMDGKCDLVAWTATEIEIYKGDGAGNWTLNGTIPNVISTSYGFRAGATGDFDHDGYTDIASFCNNGGSNSLKVFLHNATTHGLTVVPSFPHGYECLAPGSAQFVKWLSSVPAGPNATTTIEFSSTGSAGPWTNVVTSAPNSGVYQWVVPAVSSPNCCLKITVTQGTSSQSAITGAFGVGTCTATGLDEASNDLSNSLQIFPNPVTDATVLSIDMNIKVSDWKLKVFDVMGSVVYQQVLNAQVNAFSPKLSAGIYFVEVRGGETVMNKKIVIVK
jgi:hypothetical protein